MLNKSSAPIQYYSTGIKDSKPQENLRLLEHNPRALQSCTWVLLLLQWRHDDPTVSCNAPWWWKVRFRKVRYIDQEARLAAGLGWSIWETRWIGAEWMLVLKLMNAVSDECGVMEAPSFTIYRNDVWIQKPCPRDCCEDSQVSIIQRHVRSRLFLVESSRWWRVVG